nr:cytochrome P450 704C1-like [Ipomoea batatas]
MNNPKYPPVLGTVFHQLLYFNRLYDHQTETARKHSTFRLLTPGQSQIYTTDSQNIEHVLKTNFDKYAKGKRNQDVFGDLFGTGIFAVDGEKWRQQRKVASFEFSTRVLRDFSCTVFRRSAIKLVRKVEEYSQANQVFDMQDLLMRSSLESIFKVGFGVDLNCIEGEGLGSSKEESMMFMKAFDDSNELTYWRYVDPFWRLKRQEKAARLCNIIYVLKDVKSEKEDILSRFIRESKKDPKTKSDEYLRDIILNFVLAGKDSSANTLSWFFYMLYKNPLVGEKLDREIEEAFGNLKEKASSSVEDCIASITDDEVLQKMPYLHATLTETLRLYPALPDGRCAEIDDVLPDGFKVKKGDGVYYMSYAMGRMPYIWGDDAEEFRPERWLKDGIFTPESPFKFTAFHGSFEDPIVNTYIASGLKREAVPLAVANYGDDPTKKEDLKLGRESAILSSIDNLSSTSYDVKGGSLDTSSSTPNVVPTNVQIENPEVNIIHDAFAHILHGINEPSTSQQTLLGDEVLPRDDREDSNKIFYELLKDGNQELYEGCSKYSKLSFLLKLNHIKCLGGISNKAMSMIFELLKDAFEQARLPDSFYEAKKTINRLSLNYVKIHACPNDCMLYWGDDKAAETCKDCNTHLNMKIFEEI